MLIADQPILRYRQLIDAMTSLQALAERITDMPESGVNVEV